MRNLGIEWKIFHKLRDIPGDISRFLFQSSHGSLFQCPEWFSCLDTKSKKMLILSASENDNPVFGALVLKSLVPGTKYFIGTVTRGPVFEDVDTAITLWGGFEERLRSEGMIGLIVYPYWEYHEGLELAALLRERGYRTSTNISSHFETLTIDLSASEDEILTRVISSRTRNMIRKGLSMGIEVRHAVTFDELHLFGMMHTEMCRRKGIGGPSIKEFESVRAFALANPHHCACMLEYLNGSLIGGCIVLRHGNRVVYTWGSSDSSPMKGVPKTEVALWKAILWAKEIGAAVFDLGGITPDANEGGDSLRINKFKMGFSQNKIKLMPALKKEFVPFLCMGHQMVQRIAKIVRR